MLTLLSLVEHDGSVSQRGGPGSPTSAVGEPPQPDEDEREERTIADGLRPGVLLGGRYRIVRVLGQGGMGTVLLARHEELDQLFAVKLLTGESTTSPEYIARFLREGRAAGKLQSDHVVRIHDVGKWDGYGPYIVMEYLDGADLGQLVKARGPLPPAEAVDHVLQAVDALAEAHAIGIVHRDLKPANLFVSKRADGTLVTKVLDFGISKMDSALESASPSLTSTRAVMGSPHYMSPEQLKSARRVDARADVWSLGVVLYELLTGVLPFTGETVGEIFIKIVTVDPESLRALRPDIPEGLEAAVLRCLRRDPGERFANVAELAVALAPFGTGRSSKQVDRAISIIGRRAAIDGGTGPLASRGSSPALGRALGEEGVSPGGSTSASWQSGANLHHANANKAVILGVAAGTTIAVALAIGLAVGRTTAPAGSDTPVVAEPAPPPPPPSASASTPPSTTAEPVATAPATGAPSIPSATAAPRHGASPRPVVKGRCDPPYYYDGQGNRVFKKECL
jgi:serine/threonine-protein kinase